MRSGERRESVREGTGAQNRGCWALLFGCGCVMRNGLRLRGGGGEMV